MTVVSRCVTLCSLLVLSITCNNADRPTDPSPPSVGIVGTYVAGGPLSYPIQEYTASSRYVLRAGGAFELQYPSLRADYAGTYTDENGRITFRFAADRRWEAIGTFTGDALEVRYNDIMGLSDFEDAVYRRSQ
jgi:hypothetical protein